MADSPPPPPCPTCDGIGDILHHPEGIPFSQTLASMEPCPDCDGSGTLTVPGLPPLPEVTR